MKPSLNNSLFYVSNIKAVLPGGEITPQTINMIKYMPEAAELNVSKEILNSFQDGMNEQKGLLLGGAGNEIVDGLAIQTNCTQLSPNIRPLIHVLTTVKYGSQLMDFNRGEYNFQRTL